MRIPAKAQVQIHANVEVFLFPVNKIKNYHDYLLLSESPAFPHLLPINARKVAIRHEKGKNRVVDNGLNHLRDFILGNTTTSILYCGVGSGTNGVTNLDSDLQTPISRIAITNRYNSSLAGKFDTFFSTVDANGNWNETGLFSAVAAGVMFCRKLLNSTFIKSTSNTAIVAWTINFAAV